MKISLYGLLKFPFIYSFSQKLLALGAESLTKTHYGKVFRDASIYKRLVLDVGCGPEISTPRPYGTLIGADINILYVNKYSSSDKNKKINNIKNDHSCIGVVSSSDALPFGDNTFNESRCIGLLHHLPLASALHSVREMIRCTKLGGMIVIFDNVWPRNSFYRPIAWLIRKFDRGNWVRTEKELLHIVTDAYKGSYHHKRITYTYTGLEGLIIQIKKAYVLY